MCKELAVASKKNWHDVQVCVEDDNDLADDPVSALPDANEDDNASNASELEDLPTADAVIICPMICIDVDAATKSDLEPHVKRRRTHKEAVIYACQQHAQPPQEQAKSLWIVEKMDLEPFAMIMEDGTEQNALAENVVIKQSINFKPVIQAIAPANPSSTADSSNDAPPAVPGDLGSMLAISPYRDVLMSRQDARSTSSCSYLHGLRQINSKYDDPRAYHLTRCSVHLTRAPHAQPFSIFTVTDHGTIRSPGATLMSKIATKVLQHGNRATIKKRTVETLQKQANGKMKEALGAIVTLIANENDVPILGNRALSIKLEALVINLHPSIANANKTVQAVISNIFAPPKHPANA